MRSVLDLQRATVTVDPPSVVADGVAVSRVTTRLLDNSGRPVPDKTIVLSSDRGSLDDITQPSAPTDAAGVATGTIRSLAPGASQLTARVMPDSLDVPMRPTVAFTQGERLRLEKAGSRPDVTLGEIVDYTIAIRNLTPTDVVEVRLEDRLPRGFKYLRGSARLNGQATADPAGVETVTFAIGTVPALVDQNGNGQADPGEPGYLELAYRLVVGAGSAPGVYVNTAVAKDYCATCTLSNVAEARVEVAVDPLFGLSTILGRVYEDRDGDQRQDDDEPGVGGARVALDDGTYVLTDAQGLFHFVDVKPGHRLLKLDLHSLSGAAQSTTGETQVVSLTPGLLATADFGVAFTREVASTGHAAVTGVIVDAQPALAPLDVRGDVETSTVLVNGQPDRPAAQRPAPAGPGAGRRRRPGADQPGAAAHLPGDRRQSDGGHGVAPDGLRRGRRSGPPADGRRAAAGPHRLGRDHRRRRGHPRG